VSFGTFSGKENWFISKDCVTSNNEKAHLHWDIRGQLGTLNSYLQSKKITTSGMKAANDEAVKSIQST